MNRHDRVWALGVAALLGTLAFTACSKSRVVREAEAVKNLEAANSFVKEFRQLYPQSIGFFTHFGDDLAPRVWHAKVGLGGRYILQMQMEVTLDHKGIRPLVCSSPEFVLLEVASIFKKDDGMTHFKYNSAHQVDFGPVEWNTLVRKKGDLAALGVTPSAEPPLDGFDGIWNEP